MIAGYDPGIPGKEPPMIVHGRMHKGTLYIDRIQESKPVPAASIAAIMESASKEAQASESHVTFQRWGSGKGLVHDLRRPRFQFNWGYWDGISLTARGAARRDGLTEETILAGHPNPFYAYGCLAGAAAVRGTGPHGTSSDPAWNEFLASLTDPDLIFRIEANP